MRQALAPGINTNLVFSSAFFDMIYQLPGLVTRDLTPELLFTFYQNALHLLHIYSCQKGGVDNI